MMITDAERLRSYSCETCGARSGDYCHTLSPFSVPKETDPHASRWNQMRKEDEAREQRRLALLSEVNERAARRPVKLPPRPGEYIVSRAQLIQALIPEGWGHGFSESLADRVLQRLRDAESGTPR